MRTRRAALALLLVMAVAPVHAQTTQAGVFWKRLTLGTASSIDGSAVFCRAGSASCLTVQAASTTAAYTFTFPAAAGSSGYLLSTDGFGLTSWTAPPSPSFSAITGGTNAAALHIGTGGSLDATGSGTIHATLADLATTATTATSATSATTADALSADPSACLSSRFVTDISAAGSLTCAQPAAADVTGLAASAMTDTTNATNISSGTLAAARGGAGAVTGALKGNGSGLVSQAACADLSNASPSCSTDTTSASNISSGTLGAARGGAGAITGALKGNGAGVVSQAACSDLSNAAASCSTDATNAANISSGTLPVARGGTGITSLGTGIATWLGTPSSANLASAVTDETGSGAAVFGTTPTLDTPVIASLASAQHNHTNAAGGGQLTDAALSSAVSVAKGGTGAAPGADDQVLVADSVSAATWRAIANCTDVSGNHLNYTASTNTFSCGTSSSVSAGANTALSNLASTAVNTDILPGTSGTPHLGDATHHWADVYAGTATANAWSSLTHNGTNGVLACGTGVMVTPSLRALDGTASIPAYAFSGSNGASTGMYFSNGSGALGFSVNGVSQIDFPGGLGMNMNVGALRPNRTITAAGTTGAQTINKGAGTVNLAASASSIVVTNSLVSATSIVFTVLRTADTTCTFVKSVVPTAGSFTATLNAGCTAETSLGFFVTN